MDGRSRLGLAALGCGVLALLVFPILHKVSSSVWAEGIGGVTMITFALLAVYFGMVGLPGAWADRPTLDRRAVIVIGVVFAGIALVWVWSLAHG